MRIVKNILAVILGWLGGSAINMGLVQLGHSLFPMEGIDPNDMNALAEAMSTMEPKHFLFPFLAHAIGTFVGAIIAVRVAASHKMIFAMAIGVLFLIGGIMVNYMLPGPMWFTILDLVVAYIPMAWLGGTIALKKAKASI
ncbi:hypothetical protein [Mangrovimonas sp. YM274]|uniref:hypothetical protein n=1 Tax=Mangrovimonas sp. YM274 TaxID=3070660 RepID=UPI0027DC3500|nr:hypothetical protein [Mangrovimonas sp. YM274]WMI69022.1 hypothetical protein RBH95_01315 [Mangrovimonas sp. YM274]